ncbi:MAG: 2-phosphosulfolactate phosphatase family protein [Oscillatoriales cyanobacterium RM2_1_1]|nr:2-phosphosulfolactate phosphatase family protein [Oscillatoriales cyanobacterium SM2_3_0]NJO47718.1 2-phosphosulfolactate phosphatase family protein [Oscillatoriales cyanobacterium RM2_1_1]
MELFIYHTPEATPTDKLPDCAIVVDVLRATTTIATALDAGADSIQAFSDVDALIQVSNQWPADKRIRIGERGGQKVEGFDLGNSPLSFTPEVVAGKRVFMTTTNGTRALERVQSAQTVLTAALVNRKAIVEYLMTKMPNIVWIVGSGWEGSYSLEDTVCAGAVADEFSHEGGYPIENLAANDEVHGAIALYQQWKAQLFQLLNCASHGQRLLKLGLYDDLKYCAQLDTLEIVPIQREPSILVSSKAKTDDLHYWTE